VKPLDQRHHQAAALLGRGAPQADVAEGVGVSRRTVADWLKRDDFAELVRAERARAIDAQPTMRGVLEEAALRAERPDGSVDWSVRVAAARALIGADGFGSPPEPPPPAVEYFDMDDEAEPPATSVDVAAHFAAWESER
jgi:hypothetical protein